MKHHSLLWSFTPPSGETSYLFGTMHVRDERAHQFAESLYPLIDRADAYLGEMDLDAASVSHESPSYDILQYLSEKKYNKLRAQILKSFGVNLDHVSHMHPLMIMSILSTTSLMAEHHVSLDEHLWNYAKNKNIPVSGLESFDEQFEILHSIDPKLIYKQLIALSNNPGSIRASATKSIELYVAGDLHQLYMMSKRSMQQLRKKLIYDRNKKMANVIGRLDTSKKYFISVGAGHLSGLYGLIRLLKGRGFVVRPVGTFGPIR